MAFFSLAAAWSFAEICMFSVVFVCVGLFVDAFVDQSTANLTRRLTCLWRDISRFAMKKRMKKMKRWTRSMACVSVARNNNCLCNGAGNCGLVPTFLRIVLLFLAASVAVCPPFVSRCNVTGPPDA